MDSIGSETKAVIKRLQLFRCRQCNNQLCWCQGNIDDGSRNQPPGGEGVDMTTVERIVAPDAASSLRRHLAGAGLNVLLTILAGVLAGMAFPPYEKWALAWVALVPLCIALRRTSAPRISGYLAVLFGLALCVTSLPWLAAIFGPAAVGVFFIAACPWFLFGVAFRILVERAPWWGITLLTPVLWLAVEWLRCEGWYFCFSWMQLGFTLMPHPALANALYPVVGVYGVTFIIVLVNAFITSLVLRMRSAVAAAALVFLAGALWLTSTLRVPPEAGLPTVPTLIVQNESGVCPELVGQTQAALPPETRLIVWPEIAVNEFLYDDLYASDLKRVRKLAQETHSTLIIGTKVEAKDNVPCDWLRRRSMQTLEGRLYYNTAVVFGPGGEELGRYAKRHPIQLFSDGVPGQSLQPIDTPVGKLGLMICYDFDFADTVRQAVRNDADLLVVPTFDAVGWGERQHAQHARMAQARAIEVGRYVVRATSSGVSQIISDRGTVVAEVPFGAAGTATGGACLLDGKNPYIRFGWLLPYLCLGFSLLWAFWQAILGMARWMADRRINAQQELE